MIKRTPQEIADFWQCYVAMDKNGEWYAFSKKPELGSVNPSRWDNEDESCQYVCITGFVECDTDHDWTKLYEPYDSRMQNPFYALADEFITKAKKAGFLDDDTAPHQSQVHTHQEYQVIADPDASNLFSRVNRLLADGWRPQGGIAVEHIDGENDSGYILYQAMVRGLQQ